MIEEIRKQAQYLVEKLYEETPYILEDDHSELPLVTFTWDSSDNHLKRSVTWNQDEPEMLLLFDNGTGLMFKALYFEGYMPDAYDVAQVAMHVLGEKKR